jgi:carbon starvation protein CstA
MTPLAGFVAALIAGWIIRDPLRAAAAVIVPFLAVLAAQTWTLASGRGDNPPSTVHGISYWVVQVIILAVALGITTQLAVLRRARYAAQDAAQDAGDVSGRARLATALLLVLTAVFVIGYVLDGHPVAHHNPNSPLPAAGIVGIVACVVSLAVLSVLSIRRRRASTREKLAAASPSAAVAGGRR